MSPLDRLQSIASHFTNAAPKIHEGDSHEYHHRNNFHTLSPTAFLWRAACIEPDVCPVILNSWPTTCNATYSSKYTILNVFFTGHSNLPRNRKLQSPPTLLPRNRRPRARPRLLPSKTPIQTRRHPLHQHASLPRIHIWYRRRRGSERCCELPPQD